MTEKGLLLDLGFRNYKEVWDLQLKLVELRCKALVPDAFVLVEHPHVFTVGRRCSEPSGDAIEGVPVYKVERGGLWTYHGPGQLVGYPIMSLEERGRDIRKYLRGLEEALILAVKDFEIQAERHQDHRGVWVGDRKLASIGVAVRNWITFHGFALNVNTDLNYFSLIDPCGLPASALTSMRELLGREVDMEAVKKRVVVRFQEVFETELEAISGERIANLA